MQIFLHICLTYIRLSYLEPVPDRFVLVLGGFYTGNDKTSSAEVIDIFKTDSGCTQLPDHPLIMSDGTMGYYNEKVLHCNNQHCHSYAPGASEWTPLPDSMSEQRYSPASSVIQDVWLVTGGSDSTTSTEYWDGTQFHDGPEMPRGMGLHCQVTISDSEVFFLAPWVMNDDPRTRTFLLDWNDKTWTTLDDGENSWQFLTCGQFKSNDNGWEILVTSRSATSIFNIQSR